MKKTIILLVATLSLLSCSKNDDNVDSSEKQLTPNHQNMAGDWNYSSVTKTDGTQVPYVGFCSTNKDYAHIIVNTRIDSHYYYDMCVHQQSTCDNYYFEGNRIKSCFEEFNNARVTYLTSTTMKLEYDEDKVFGSLGFPVRGLILVKR